MGACFGRCFSAEKNFNFRFRNNDDRFNLVDETNANSANENRSFVYRIMNPKTKKHSKFIERFWNRCEINNYSRLNLNKTTASEIQLQCLDAHSLLVKAREKNLNNRDFNTGMTASPTGSSLDLEWEHEYASNQQWIALPEEVTVNDLSSEDDCSSNNSELHKPTKKLKTFNSKPINGNSKRIRRNHKSSITGQSSVTSWSHTSTPDSLEWDIDDDQQQHFQSDDSLDQETKELLLEIEQLKNRVLSETGISLKNSIQNVES